MVIYGSGDIGDEIIKANGGVAGSGVLRHGKSNYIVSVLRGRKS